MPRDHRDFGETPKSAKNVKLPSAEDLAATRRDGLLKIVAAQGKFAPRAARWLAPRELRHLLRDDFPFESSSLYAVPDPRQIKDADDLLDLCADRRAAYAKYLKERKADKQATKP